MEGVHDERAEVGLVVRFGEDEEATEDGEGELEWGAEAEGVEVLEEPLHDGRRLRQVEGSRREAQFVGRLGRRPSARCRSRRPALLRDRVEDEFRLRLLVEALLLGGDDALRSLLEVVELVAEPRPAIVEDLARAPEAFPVRADDLEVGEVGLGQGEKAERLCERGERLRRGLVDSERLEVDEGDVGEVRLPVVVVGREVTL